MARRPMSSPRIIPSIRWRAVAVEEGLAVSIVADTKEKSVFFSAARFFLIVTQRAVTLMKLRAPGIRCCLCSPPSLR